MKHVPLTLLLCLVLTSKVFAQPVPPLNGVVATDSSQLDISAVNAAAAPLLAAGQEVVVLFIDANVGDTLEDASAYFDRALESYGVLTSGTYDPNLFALYIGTNPRAVYRAYGAGLEPIFYTSKNGATFDQALQDAVVVPRLLAGDFSGAATSALNYVATQLENARPASVTLPDATTNTAPESQTPVVTTPTPLPSGNAERPALFGRLPLLVLLLGLVVLLLRRRRRATTPRTQTQAGETRAGSASDVTLSNELHSLKGEVSARLIDLSSSDPTPGDAYLPDDPGDNTDMVLLGDLLAQERPEELAQLQTEYAQNVAALQQLDARFVSLQQSETPHMNAAQLESLTGGYRDLLAQAEGIKAFSTRLSERFSAVQQEISALPEQLESLATALTAATSQYEAARSPGWPDTSELLAPLEADLQAARDLAQKQPLSALKRVELVRRSLETVTDASRRLADTEKRLLGFRMSLDAQRQQGYKLTDRDKVLEEAQYHLDVALGLLKQREYKVLDAQVDEVAELSDKLIDGTKALVALRATNETRLEELQQEGEAIKAVIEAAAVAFDAADDYAPSTWRDIRGNGTEAQKAADRAQQLWEQAQELNRMDGAQDFEAARAAIEAGFAELEQVRKLSAAIEERLQHLREAQATARQQLELVEQDLRSHLRLLSQPEVDREVSDAPAHLLQKADKQLETARTALNDQQPDWLLIIDHVQQADTLCDEALAAIRNEQEAMQHRRVRLKSEKTEATGALDRVMQYARVHSSDIDTPTLSLIREAQAHYQQAEQQEAGAETLADEALVTALESAISLYDRAEKLADDAFKRAETNFTEMEGLRAKAAAAAASVQASYDNLARFAARADLSSSAQRTLYALQNSLPYYSSEADRATLEEVLRRAGALEQEIVNVQAELRQQLQQRETALRQERERRLEVERRRRAADWGRSSSGWGTWNQPTVVFPSPSRPRVSSSPSYSSRPMPTARRSAPVSLPSRRPSSSGRSSGGSWGGSGRKSGGGW